MIIDIEQFDQAIRIAKYEELYNYAVLTYDRTGRIAKERLAELKRQIEEE